MKNEINLRVKDVLFHCHSCPLLLCVPSTVAFFSTWFSIHSSFFIILSLSLLSLIILFQQIYVFISMYPFVAVHTFKGVNFYVWGRFDCRKLLLECKEKKCNNSPPCSQMTKLGLNSSLSSHGMTLEQVMESMNTFIEASHLLPILSSTFKTLQGLTDFLRETQTSEKLVNNDTQSILGDISCEPYLLLDISLFIV